MDALLWVAVIAVVVGVLAFWKAAEAVRGTDQALRELYKTRLYELPRGGGAIDLDAIVLISHNHDGVNTFVWIDGEDLAGAGRSPALYLTWAQGIELEQAWKARVEEKNRRLSKD